MEFSEVISKRRSIRKFKDDPVPDEYVLEMVRAARLAPTGSNLQATRFVIIKEKDKREKIGESTPYAFVRTAPVVFVCCVDMSVYDSREQRRGELIRVGALEQLKPTALDDAIEKHRNMGDWAARKAYLSLNAAIGIDHMTLKAVELGLGTCWIVRFDEEKAKTILNLDSRYEVVALLPTGFPDQDPPPRPRIPLEDYIIQV